VGVWYEWADPPKEPVHSLLDFHRYGSRCNRAKSWVVIKQVRSILHQPGHVTTVFKSNLVESISIGHLLSIRLLLRTLSITSIHIDNTMGLKDGAKNPSSYH
jgi:hypothetical protein